MKTDHLHKAVLVAVVPAVGIVALVTMHFIFSRHFLSGQGRAGGGIKKRKEEFISREMVSSHPIPPRSPSPSASDDVGAAAAICVDNNENGGSEAAAPKAKEELGAACLPDMDCDESSYACEKGCAPDAVWYSLRVPAADKGSLLEIQERIITGKARNTVHREIRAIVNVRKSNFARLEVVNAVVSGVEEMLARECRSALMQLREVVERGPFCSLSTMLEALRAVRDMEEFCGALSLQPFLFSVNCGDGDDMNALRKRIAAKVAKTPLEFMERLSPFTCFLIGRFLAAGVEMDVEAHVVAALLQRSVSCVLTERSDSRQFPIQTLLPLDDSIPFYVPFAWLQLARVLEKIETSRSLHSQSGRRVREVLLRHYNHIGGDRNDGSGIRFSSLASYRRAIEISNGNNWAAWRAAGMALHRIGGECIRVFGEWITASQCFAEAIRCRGGRQHCTECVLWREAADSLCGSLCREHVQWREDTLRGGVSAAVLITLRCNEPFVFPLRFYQPGYVVMNKADCLVEYLNRADTPCNGDFLNWCNLALCLSSHVERQKSSDGYHLSLCEERITVAGRCVTRLDCIRRAIQLNPSVAALWYHAAITLEDDVAINAEGATADAAVCRQFFLDKEAPKGHVEALCRGLEHDIGDCRLWLALGLALLRRSRLMVQPSMQRVEITLWGKKTEEDSDKNMAEQWGDDEGEKLGGEAPNVTVSVSAEYCFDKCRKIDPGMADVINSCLQGQEQHQCCSPLTRSSSCSSPSHAASQHPKYANGNGSVEAPVKRA